MRFSIKRLLSLATALIFLSTQMSPVYAQNIQDLAAQTAAEENKNTPAITAAEAYAKQYAQSATGQIQSPGVPDTFHFISGDNAIQPVKGVRPLEEKGSDPFGYSFDEARDLFRSEFSTAVILEAIREEDLKALTEFPFEVGLAILHGELVMFSSGNESEINILNPVSQLLEEAELIAHSHPVGHSITQPGGQDIQLAGSLTEYVVSPAGIYAYNHDGIKNSNKPFSYGYLSDEISRTLERARLSGTANEMLAREKLNEFIRQMDLLNQAAADERVLFRSGAVIGPNPGLNAGNITALPSPPDVLLTGGSSAGSAVNQPSGSSVHLNYNISTVGSYAGITLNYDNFGTQNIESQNLSQLQSLIFGLRSSAAQIKVEITDAANNRDFFILTGIGTADRFYQMNMNLFSPAVDRSRVTQINFIVDQTGTMPANYVGTLDLTFANLNVTGNQAPDPNLTAANVTSLPGSPSPVLVGSNHLPGSVLTQPSSSQLNFTYNLLQNDSFAAAVLTYDDFSSPAVQTGNLSNLPNNEIIIGVSGPAGSILRIEFEEELSTPQNPIKDFLNLGPMNGAEQFYRINLNNLSGVDLSRIKGINFVVDRFTADPANGTANRQGNFSFRLGPGLNVTGSQLPDPNLTAANISTLPLRTLSATARPGPVLVNSSNAAASLNQSTRTEFRMNYDVTPLQSQQGVTQQFAASVVNYDDFGNDDGNPATTADVETGNLTLLAGNQLIVGLTGTPGMGVRAVFEDINGNKDFLNLTNLSLTEQFYRLDLSLLSGIDLTRIKGISFEVNGFLAQNPNIGGGPFAGFLNVKLNGLDVTGNIANDATLTAASITTLPGNPNPPGPILTGGSNPPSNVTQQTNDLVTLNYNVTPVGAPDEYAGITFNYDDFTSSPLKESANFSGINEIIVGLSGTPNTRVQAVFEDAQGGRDFLNLDTITAGEQYYRLNLSLLDGVNLSQITGISFVEDRFNVLSFTGTLNVRLNGLDVTGNILPNAALTAADIITLPNNPGPVFINSASATGQVTQSSRNQARLTYDVTPVVTGTPPNTVTTHQFAGMLINYDDFNSPAVESRDLSSITNFIFGLTGTPGMDVRVLFEDSNGGSDFFNLGQLGAGQQFYSLNRNLLSGVDFTRISGISFAVSGTQTPGSAGPFQGFLDVNVNGLDVTGLLVPDPSLNVGNVTQLFGNPGPVLVKSASAAANLAQQSQDLVALTYDVTPVVTGTPPNQVVTHQFAEALFNYDNFATPGLESQDLSALTEIVVGLSGTPGMNVAVVFEDAAGGRDTLNLGQLSAAEQFYRIPRAFIDNVNFAQITGIGFVVSGTQAQNPQPGGGPFAGNLNVRLSGLDVTGFIPPSPGLTAANVTQMPNQPRPVVTGGSSAPTAINQLSSSQVDLSYDVTQASSYSGLTIAYDNPATPAIESGNLTAIGNLVTGLRGPAGSNVRVEFIDASGARDFLNVGPVTTAEQFYSLNLGLLSGINLAQIANVNFIVTQALAQDTQDILSVRLGNLDFLGSSFIQPTAGLTAANVSVMPGTPEVLLTGGSNAGSSVIQLSQSRTNLIYDVTPAGSFAGINVNYDNAATPGIEFRDLSPLGGQMIVGLAGPVGTNVRVEFEDSTGARNSLTLGSVNTTEQFYQLNFAQVTGIDFTRIRRVNFLIDNSFVLDRQDTLGLRLDGLLFTNIVQPTAGLTEANLTNFQAGNPGSILVGGSSADSSIAQFSTSRVDLDYDVTAQSSFAGAGVSFDNFTTGPVEVINLSTLTEIVVGVRGQIGDTVRFEIEDSGTAKASVILGNINTVEQFYRIPLNLFQGINLSSVAAINFVVDGNFVTDPTNVMRFRVAGLTQPALTAQEQAIRQDLISDHIGFFIPGVGIDPATHFPFDNITSAAVPQRFTQPTSIGFYLQILSDIAGGRISNPGMTSSQALAEANLVLDNLLSAQANFGWNGLIPFLNLSPFGASTTQVATGDNANLAQSIAAFVGGLERSTFSGADQALATTLINKAATTLGNMAPGFQQMFDPSNGLLRAEVNRITGVFTSLWIDRFNNEFRAPVGFVSLFYGINQSVFLNPSSLNKTYLDSLGNNVDIMSSFDGGAFQIFWPLLRANEEKYVEVVPALSNFLYASADYSRRNNIPGLVSASSTPEGPYVGLLGVPELGEINPFALVSDVGSVYALAAAFAVAPSFVISWLDSLRTQAPALSGPFGIFDAFRSATEVSQRFFAIDQASLVLGLADTGGDSFDVFMQNRNLKDDFERLYEQKFIDITPNQIPLPGPPVVPARTFAVLNNFSSQGSMGTFTNGSTNLTSNSGYTILNNFNYANQGSRAGHFFVLDQIHDAAGETLVIDYSTVTTPQQIEIELINNLGAIAGTFVVPIAGGAGFREAQVLIPNANAFRQISRVNVLVNPGATGVQSANFNIHSLQFKFLGTIPPIAPTGGLTAANVTTLPANFGLVTTGGSAAGTSFSQLSSSQFVTNINNQAVGNFGGASVTFDNFTTPAVTETQNFSAVPQLVFGLSSPQFTQGKLEFVDISGNRSTFNLTGITNSEQFWAVDLNNLAPGFNRAQVALINFIIDTQAQGVLNVRTAGLPFTPVFNPDPSLTLAQVSTLNNPAPEARLTFGSVAASFVVQPSVNEIALTYNHTAAGQFSGATLNFDDFGAAGIQSINLSAVPDIILGLRANPNIPSVKLEFIDAFGAVSNVTLNGVTGSEQFWRVPLSNFSGVNLSQIRFINVVVDQVASGNMTLRVNGQQFTPVVQPNPALTNTNITVLAPVTGGVSFPIPGLTGGSSAGTNVTSNSAVNPDLITLNYNVTQAGSYSGATVFYENFATGPQETGDLTKGGTNSELVFGVRRTGPGTDTIRVKLELVDANGMRATVFIDSVTANPSIYSVPFNQLPAGFDLTRVTMFSYVVDQNSVTAATQTGTIEVTLNGIQ